MYRNILVPTDGSDHAATVLDHALELADRYEARVHGLYVINTPSIGTTDPDSRQHIIEAAEERGREAVRAVADGATARGLEATTEVTRGSPSEEILDYAEAQGVDLIVMGTHGRTGLGRFLLGSVAERVSRHATVPVLLVRATDADERARE